jgi:stage II sporulation protein R
MKNACISFLIVAIIILSGLGLNLSSAQVETEYLRIHIRADSNLDSDQAVKYKVKDAVVEYLTPFIAECDTKKKAERLVLDNLKGIEEVANSVLDENGFSYKSKAKVKSEKFPTRFYGGVCLETGYYDALILELGSGKGDNWWCVVYPPLCFTGEAVKYEYKSKIKEIVDEFFLKRRTE